MSDFCFEIPFRIDLLTSLGTQSTRFWVSYTKMSASLPPNFESRDFYARLGVGKNASMKEIKQAFRALARDHHPDVAGENTQAAERFKKIREAYETLSDPTKRQRYDARGRARPGLNAFRWEPTRPQDNQAHRQSYADDLDLDDIFSDKLKGGIFRGGPPSSVEPDFGFGHTSKPRSEPGADIGLRVEISGDLAVNGGTHTLEYVRLRHSESQTKLEPYDEIFDLRLGAGTEHGASVRIPKMGHAGVGGGPYGDLVCDIVVRGSGRSAERVGDTSDSPSHEVDSVLKITVQEALLGGRAVLRCPAGKVTVVIPPCTSSGSRLRLAQKGPLNSSGERTDHEVVIQIVTPRELDEESRHLIERFAMLNAYDPKEG